MKQSYQFLAVRRGRVDSFPQRSLSKAEGLKNLSTLSADRKAFLMSFSPFLSAAKRPQQTCRVLRDPGPSALHMQHSCTNILQTKLRQNIASSARFRSFYSSPAAALPYPTSVAQYPRWINTRKNGLHNESDAEGNEEEEGDSSEGPHGEEKHPDARLDSSDGSGKSSGSSSSAQSPASNGSSNSGGSSSSSGSGTPPSPNSSSNSSTQISKQSIPEHYPQVLALPIARRPLFPGFYKAVVVRNPGVVAAIKEMMKRGQPYLGAFLLKDENTDSDVITDINSVHHVGVFAQITSVFAATGKDDKEEGLTAVLYPHRRIRLTGLVKSGSNGSSATVESVENTESEVASGIPTPPSTPPPTESIESAKDLAQTTARTLSPSYFALSIPWLMFSCTSACADCLPTKL